MTTAKELLGVTFEAAQFALSAQNFVQPRTVRRLERAVEVLQRITREHRSFSNEEPPDAGEVYRLFMRLVRQSGEELRAAFETPRMQRKLAWSLCYAVDDGPWISRSPYLPQALALLDKEPAASVLLGLFNTLLRIWDDREAATLLRRSLPQHVEAYRGRRKILLTIKAKAAFFFEASGAVKLGGMLAAQEVALSSLWDLLSLPAHMEKYPYFSEVAVAYTHKMLGTSNYRAYIPDILEFLAAHGPSVATQNPSFATKWCLSKIIIKLDETSDDDLRDQVQTFAFEKIGDPAHDYKWRPWPGATKAAVLEIEQAHAILNHWIAQRFIVAFFNKVTMDPDREAFWLSYTRHVTRFKVFSDGDTKRRLRSDERLRPYIQDRFSTISGSASALMMQIKDKMIIEFSETGNACYVYERDNQESPSYTKRYSNVNDLKRPNMQLLFRSSGDFIYDLKKEGRVLHHNRWEYRMRGWMKEFLDI